MICGDMILKRIMGTLSMARTLNVFGVYSSGGYPGSVYTARFSLLSNDSIILYGGQGYALNQIGMLNDVWRYDSQSNLWFLSKDLK